MKQKFLLLFLLVALILTGCSKMSEEKIETLETRPECNGEHVEVDIPEENVFAYYTFCFYRDADGNSIVVEKCSEHHEAINVQSYPDPHFVKEDFYKLNDGMDIYEIVELVGVPTDSFTSGVFSTNFIMDDGDSLMVTWSADWKAQSFRYIERTDN